MIIFIINRSITIIKRITGNKIYRLYKERKGEKSITGSNQVERGVKLVDSKEREKITSSNGLEISDTPGRFLGWNAKRKKLFPNQKSKN